MVELLDLSSANFDKAAILRAGYADPIQPNLVMGNTATGRMRFDDLDNVLHRGLAIFAALGEGVGAGGTQEDLQAGAVCGNYSNIFKPLNV